MKNWFKKVNGKKFGNLLAGLALTVATIASNSACALWIYQEEENDDVKKLRKF